MKRHTLWPGVVGFALYAALWLPASIMLTAFLIDPDGPVAFLVSGPMQLVIRLVMNIAGALVLGTVVGVGVWALGKTLRQGTLRVAAIIVMVGLLAAVGRVMLLSRYPVWAAATGALVLVGVVALMSLRRWWWGLLLSALCVPALILGVYRAQQARMAHRVNRGAWVVWNGGYASADGGRTVVLLRDAQATRLLQQYTDGRQRSRRAVLAVKELRGMVQRFPALGVQDDEWVYDAQAGLLCWSDGLSITLAHAGGGERRRFYTGTVISALSLQPERQQILVATCPPTLDGEPPRVLAYTYDGHLLGCCAVAEYGASTPLCVVPHLEGAR